MNASNSIPVKTDTRLDVSYMYDEPADMKSQKIASLMHGVVHSGAFFQRHTDVMNGEGVPTARIDIQSNGRNFISMNRYVHAHHQALLQIQQDTGRKIGSIGGHSMGGMIVQETVQKFEDCRKPTVLIAPIPLHGALPAFMRALASKGSIGKSVKTLLKSMKGLDITNIMKTEDEVRTLFFEENTDAKIVREMLDGIRKTSYLAYLSLLSRPLTRGFVEYREEPTMLMISRENERDTDFLFKKHEYEDLHDVYIHKNLREVEVPGGHDCFMVRPDITGKHHAEFHLQNDTAA